MSINEEKTRRWKPFMIANPMFNTVFSQLMEDDCAAKIFIGTLLGEEVISLKIHPQSYDKAARDDMHNPEKSIRGLIYSIYRITFIATVKTKEGTDKKIFIDVQKTIDEYDAIRFRNYLSDLYQRDDKATMSLPVITIYILGFDLKGIDSRCIKIEHNYTDMFNNQSVNAKTPFMGKPMHDSYVIQTKESSVTHYDTKLEQLLGIFEQAHFIDDTSKILKRYNLQSDDEDIKFIINTLYEMGADPDERKKLEIEVEAIRTMEWIIGGMKN
jgi:hypothetical protein